MTGEELIRDVWRRWNAGERDLDAESFDPEFEIHSALAQDVFRGVDGVRRWTAEIDQQFDAWEILIDSIEEDRPGSFLAQGSIRARGRHSGVGLDQSAGWRIDLRGGRILRVRNFIGPEAAAQASLS
jgi:ketosteroid isomerase-like protein